MTHGKVTAYNTGGTSLPLFSETKSSSYSMIQKEGHLDTKNHIMTRFVMLFPLTYTVESRMFSNKPSKYEILRMPYF